MKHSQESMRDSQVQRQFVIVLVGVAAVGVEGDGLVAHDDLAGQRCRLGG